MKSIVLFLIFFPTLLFSQVVKYCPLEEDEISSQQFRIENIIFHVEEIEKIIENSPMLIKDPIDWHILIIRLNLGCPIEYENLEAYFD